MWHYLTVVSNYVVLAKGGSKLETTTAQLARKSSVWPENLKFFHMYLSEIHHRYKGQIYITGIRSKYKDCQHKYTTSK